MVNYVFVPSKYTNFHFNLTITSHERNMMWHVQVENLKSLKVKTDIYENILFIFLYIWPPLDKLDCLQHDGLIIRTFYMITWIRSQDTTPACLFKYVSE